MRVITKRMQKEAKKRILIILLSSILVGVMAISIIISINNNSVSTFKSLFLSNKYSEAKAYYEDKSNTYVGKKLPFNKDIHEFLNTQLKTAIDKYEKSEINSEALLKLSDEIKGYNILSEENLFSIKSEIETIEVIKHINKLLNESKDYEGTLRVIEDSQNKYPNLQQLSSLREQTFKLFKEAIFSEAQSAYERGNIEYAISKLQNKLNYFPKDLEYKSHIENYINLEEQILLKQREDREKKKNEEAGKAIATAVTTSTKSINISLNRGDFNTSEEYINATNLGSTKPYLIYVDLKSQKTEVFSGSRGNWKLTYSFISSTGKSDEPTPKGVYKVTGRGSWFYSEKFQQGAKWFVQFWDDYLFHSLPMDREKNIVDPTLGTPASHGCVRLKVEDSKWLYDNIPNGATVFIK